MKADPSFRNASAGFSFYHPVANVIISCLEKRINFINRGLFEVRNLQSENFVSEKFAITTYARLIEGFMRDFTSLQQDVEVSITGSAAITLGKTKVFESEYPSKYRMLFCPIDNITNFSRGLSECGTLISLQSILPSTAKAKYENVFSIFFSFKFQKFIYAENKGFVYFENKRMKALNRKTSLVFSLNTSAIIGNVISSEKFQTLRIKEIFSRESIVSDCFELANGGIDALIYVKIKLSEAIAIQMLAISLGFFTSEMPEASGNYDVNADVNLVVGGENVIKLTAIEKFIKPN
jgi:fructose-1,6-bisphosphatase/inositol monophosphatase family enzyme